MPPASEHKIQALEDKIDSLEKTVVTLSKSVEDLVTAWNTAKGMTAFIKWLSSLAVAATVLYNVWKGSST